MVRIPAGPLGSLKCDSPKGNGRRPKKNQCTTGTYHLVLRNDARAAISISSMEGLLRRVRHIELRAKYIQMLVKKKRLLLEHIPGLQNPSDGLTKSFKTRDMLINLERGRIGARTRHQRLVVDPYFSAGAAVASRRRGDVKFVGRVGIAPEF